MKHLSIKSTVDAYPSASPLQSKQLLAMEKREYFSYSGGLSIKEISDMAKAINNPKNKAS